MNIGEFMISLRYGAMAVPDGQDIRQIEDPVHVTGDLLPDETDDAVDDADATALDHSDDRFSLRHIETVESDLRMILIDECRIEVFEASWFAIQIDAVVILQDLLIEPGDFPVIIAIRFFVIRSDHEDSLLFLNDLLQLFRILVILLVFFVFFQ